MTTFPTVPARDIIRYLKKQGFVLLRQKGSHKFFRHLDGRTATVPDHKGEDIGKGLMLKILKDIEVSQQDFLDWYAG
jgi:predicted RNA binding protein YcfA (HicA-like mRNA interferase family)